MITPSTHPENSTPAFNGIVFTIKAPLSLALIVLSAVFSFFMGRITTPPPVVTIVDTVFVNSPCVDTVKKPPILQVVYPDTIFDKNDERDSIEAIKDSGSQGNQIAQSEDSQRTNIEAEISVLQQMNDHLVNQEIRNIINRFYYNAKEEKIEAFNAALNYTLHTNRYELLDSVIYYGRRYHKSLYKYSPKNDVVIEKDITALFKILEKDQELELTNWKQEIIEQDQLADRYNRGRSLVQN